MNNIEKFYVIAAPVAIVAITVEYIKVTREERRKRTEIKAEEQLQLKAIYVAGERVRNMINTGKYDHNMSIATIMNDFKFETIAAREE